MFKCPNCNGSLYFNVGKQLLSCRHCGSEIKVEDYQKDNKAVYEDLSLYTCSNCGAKLISPEQSAVGFCSYCGSEQIMEEKLTEELDPEKIIPFTITKKECTNIYKKTLNGYLYAPKEFRDPAFIEKFRGIYIPYWYLRTGFTKDPVPVKAYSEHYENGYDYYREYELEASLKHTVNGDPRDASSSFDDSIADEIAPFKAGSMKDYHPGYLAGFYADTADVDPEIYTESTLDRAAQLAADKITTSIKKQKDMTPILPDNDKKLRELLKPEIRGKVSMLLPVWFLTWRKKNRVAYMVVNGNTGRINTEMPVSYLIFFLFVLVTAIVLFGLMTLFVSMTAPTALLISMTCSTIAVMMYQRQLKRIHDKEMHVFDRGWFIEGRETDITEKKAEKIRRRRERGFWDIPAGIMTFLLFALEFATYWFNDGMPDEDAQLGAVFLFPVLVYNVLRALTFAKNVKEKSLIPEVLAGTAGIAFGYYVLFTLQVHDYMYYIGCMLCLAAALLMCTGMIRKFNVLATRPLPSFFERTGGNDNA